MVSKTLNLLLDVFKQILEEQIKWDEHPFLLNNDYRHIYLTSHDDMISGCKIGEYLQAALALSVTFRFEIFEDKLRVVFH